MSEAPSVANWKLKWSTFGQVICYMRAIVPSTGGGQQLLVDHVLESAAAALESMLKDPEDEALGVVTYLQDAATGIEALPDELRVLVRRFPTFP